MKTLLLATTLAIAALFRTQAEEFPDSQIIYDIGDDGIHAIASRLGLRYDERGMGINGLGRGRYAFDAMVPGWGCDTGMTPAQARKRAATPKPLVLSYSSSRKHFRPAAVSAWNADSWQHITVANSRDGTASLSATFYLTHGITFRAVLEHVRRFTREIRDFDAHL